MIDQRDMADRLADVLVATAGELAAWQDQVPVTAPEPELVDVIRLLAKTATRMQDFARRAYLGEVTAGEWGELASRLHAGAEVCRHWAVDPVIVEEAEPGES